MKFRRGAILRRLAMLAIMMQAFLVASAYDFEVDGIYYNVISLEDMTCKVTKGDNEYEGDIVIPSTVEYNTRKFTVIQIGSKAFCQCTGLTSVEFPSSLTTIGMDAFNYCLGLTSVVFSEGLTSIGESAFKYCGSLTSIVFPEGLTTIGDSAFYGCSGLTSVVFPESLTTIGSSAFCSCSGLTSIVFPENLTKIGAGAFKLCIGLTSVEFEEGILPVNIASTVFQSSPLKQVILPRPCKMSYLDYSSSDKVAYFFFELKYLKVSTLECAPFFNGNHSYRLMLSSGKIETMELDNVVWTSSSSDKIKVENLIFSEKYCAEKPNLEGFTARSSFEFDFSELKTLVSKTLEPPVIPREVPNKILMEAEVQVPIEALEKYQQAPVWKDFWNLKGVEGLVGIESAEVIAPKEVGRYDLTGKAVSEDYRGIVIVRYSDGTTSKTIQR